MACDVPGSVSGPGPRVARFTLPRLAKPGMAVARRPGQADRARGSRAAIRAAATTIDSEAWL